MNIRFFVCVFSFSFCQLLPAHGENSQGDYIRLVDPLDEPEFYCLDLAGWGAHLQLDDPLQTHTCKIRGGDDQMFQFADGHLKISLYDRCVQVAGSGEETLAGSAVLARTCSDNGLQKLAMDEKGRIRIAGTGFCIGAGERSTEASGPSHMWRTLTVVDCDSVDEKLATWQVGLKQQ